MIIEKRLLTDEAGREIWVLWHMPRGMSWRGKYHKQLESHLKMYTEKERQTESTTQTDCGQSRPSVSFASVNAYQVLNIARPQHRRESEKGSWQVTPSAALQFQLPSPIVHDERDTVFKLQRRLDYSRRGRHSY